MTAFDTAITSPILLDLIRGLGDLGYPVRAVVSDMGSKNMTLWRDLKIAHDGETSIVNPHQEDR